MAPWDEINAFNIVKGIKEMDVDMYSFCGKIYFVKLERIKFF